MTHTHRHISIASHTRPAIVTVTLGVLAVLLAASCLVWGSVDIDPSAIAAILTGHSSGNYAWDVIITQSRLPMIATSALAGAALAVAGLLLQTTFNNPLADPSVLGVSAGAGLGVAVVMLATGGSIGSMLGQGFGGYMATMAAAMTGAVAVLAVLMLFAGIVRSATMLLIVGIMVSYLASSVISLLSSVASHEGLQGYVAWGFGNFTGITTGQLPMYAGSITIALAVAVAMVKPLNAMLLGTRYAQNLGVNVRNVRNVLLLVAGALTAVVTAFCGPIGFIGMVVPHIARLATGTSSHGRLLPATMLAGADVALLCTLISVTCSSHGVLPINAITPIVGVPVIIYIIVNRRRIQYFN